MQAALSACLPPAITLRCLPVAWLPGGLVELQVTGQYKGCWSCVCAVCGWRLRGTVQQIKGACHGAVYQDEAGHVCLDEVGLRQECAK